VQKLIEALAQARVVLVSAGPGEGKQSVAAKALDTLYEEGKAFGGVWSCNLAGVESSDEISIRLVVIIGP
jgi:nucleoside-triphosphatase THEP1